MFLFGLALLGCTGSLDYKSLLKVHQHRFDTSEYKVQSCYHEQ